MADLLRQVVPLDVAPDYVAELLRAFAAEASIRQPLPVTQAELVEPLTRREQEILVLLAQRLTAKEIAQQLVISDQTVKRHRANIYQKLGANSRRQAIAEAIAFGILPTST